MPSALAVFTCRPNSHPFQERHVYLDEPVKIGRSVARCRPAQNNATFDCKVLSRNHALVWFDHKTGKVRHHKSLCLIRFYKRGDACLEFYTPNRPEHEFLHVQVVFT